MPKNKGKGGKNRKKGKNDALPMKRELLFAEDGQTYGMVSKMLGSCNVDLECTDGTKRIGHIRGAMRKKVWMRVGDTVLLSLRDFQDDKADIIHVFDGDEVRMLRSYEELPSNWGGNEKVGVDDVTIEDNGDDNVDSSDVVFDIDEI